MSLDQEIEEFLKSKFYQENVKDKVEFCKKKTKILNTNDSKGFTFFKGDFEDFSKKKSLGTAYFGVRNQIIRIYKVNFIFFYRKLLEKNEKILIKGLVKENRSNEYIISTKIIYLVKNDTIITEYEDISKFSIPVSLKFTKILVYHNFNKTFQHRI